jgi:MoxR-like ATPase
VTEQDEDAGAKAAEDAADDEDADDDDEDEDEDDGEDIKHPIVDRLMKYLAAGLNVALVGPAGTGKSFIARQAAELLGADFYTNGAMLSKYDLIGFTDAHGTYHDTPAYRAFVDGGVHCFDELDASAPDAVVAFNGMTDDQPWYTFPNGQQSKHENYVAIACMNTFGNGATAAYVGRHKQDAAAMDRFVLLYVDYDPKIETRIAGKHKDILNRVRAIRAACTELGITHIVSYRMFLKAVRSREQGVSKRHIDSDILFAGLDDGAIRQIKTRVNAATKTGSTS